MYIDEWDFMYNKNMNYDSLFNYIGCDNMLSGYKCFNKDLTNRYGQKFEVGVLYHCNKDIKFGNDGHGFHMCVHLEDTLRYFDAMNDEVNICKVNCYGKKELYEDNYYGYYDMYATEYMVIEKILTREEIIFYALGLEEDRLTRFISLFKLTEKEKQLFLDKFSRCQNVLDYIAYYQNDDKEVFKKRIKQK